MPLYSYKCQCGKAFDRFLKLADYQAPQTCECGAVAEKVLTAAAVRGDYEGYQCPVSGSWIEGRRAHEENLKRHGCRVLEPGETQASRAGAAAEESALDAKIENTVEGFIQTLPSAKREQLATELANEADTTVVRQGA